jgi:hypothetical protein
MPCTAIKTTTLSDDELFLKIITEPLEEGIKAMIYKCDVNWVPYGNPDVIFRGETEEEFHINLRKSSKLLDEFNPNESTNQEWNDSTS